ncbi:hypothetical protein EVAR_64327_1 [Eumeta japonica]|uniref:Uncharacterized protein n=1 Tax=Eumeta variegata TaxID=151549 RepID=A0A4C1ZB06_EUMVA|nr:hypothetical protein EVAR_64327_1 [Eumeta japonica]
MIGCSSVGRIAKFLGNTGTPILTTGGFSFDFVLPKTTCEDEFHMVVRTGGLGFQDIAYFIINVMRHAKLKDMSIHFDETSSNIKATVVDISSGKHRNIREDRQIEQGPLSLRARASEQG